MKDSAAKSASRAFAILELFQIRQCPLALKDVIAELGFPTSSGEELLKCLCHEGYLCFDPVTRSYMPTPKIARLGSWVPDAMLMRGRLQAAAERLSALSGEMIAVATANELYMQNLTFLPPTKPVSIAFDSNRIVPLVISAMGVSWLSEEDELRIERLYRQSVARGLIDRDALTLNRLLCRVEAVRGRDVAVIDSARHDEATLLAINVLVPSAQRRVVMSIGGPTSRIRGQLDMFRAALADERHRLLEAA